jgi:hypothetical protein
MKMLLWLFLSLAVFTACNKDDKPQDSQNTQQQTNQNSQQEQNTQQNDNSQNDNSQNAAGDNGGIKDLTYDAGKLPGGIKYDGKVVTSAKWSDKNGENYIFVTETAEKTQKGEERMKELFGYHFTVNSGEAKQIWKINDFIKDCPLDITLEYMPKSLSVTDLDKNGIAETTFLYRMSCRGDVSEDDMKLMMHEGDNKYAIRGSMKLKMEGETYGGEMKADPSFDKAPKEFLNYAKEQWNKFQTEKTGN